MAGRTAVEPIERERVAGLVRGHVALRLLRHGRPGQRCISARPFGFLSRPQQWRKSGNFARAAESNASERRSEAMPDAMARPPARLIAVARHSIYGMLLPVPVVCFIGVLVSDLAYLR